MKHYYLLLYIALTIFACKKTNNIVDPEENPSPTSPARETFTQYGTPFVNVPDPQDATIYQVNIRAFSNTGNFQGVLNRIDSIKALGINVIYLMPIYPVGQVKAINSPYCIKSYVEVNTEFGSLTDLRALVDAAHSRNIAVMLDWVANHTAWDHPWITLHPTWYLTNSAGTIVSPPNTGWNDVAQLSFANAEMRLEMIKSMKYWVYTANVDGFRCDFSDGPPVSFWTQAIDTLRNITTHKLLILSEGTRSSNYSAGFNYNFGFGFYDNLKKIYKTSASVVSIDNLNSSEYTGSSGIQQVVRYITNHDVNSSDGSPISLFGGKKGSMAAFVVAAYMKAIPMIYNGQEVGTSYSIPFPFTSAKVNWNVNPDVTAEYKKVIALRNDNPTIKYGALTSYSSADVCAFTKQYNNDTVFVLSNLRNSAKDFSLPLDLQNRTWRYAFKTDSLVNLTTTVSLQAYDYTVLVKQ